MAIADDIDPAQASRRASEGLQRAIESLDRHTEALIAPTMEMALVQKKRASEIGLEELEPSNLLRKFISQAVPLGIGSSIGASLPGQLNPDASSAERGSSPVGSGPRWNEMFGAEPGHPGAPSPWAKEPSAIRGKTNIEAQRLEEEPIRIPSFGDWRVDALMKLGSQVAGKKALGNYESYASQAGEEAMSSQEWLSQQGPLAAGNVSGALATGAERVAQASAVHAKILKPLLDLSFAASGMGASLGYSPQAGTGINASHVFGIANPIAAFTSPAAKQGLGTVVNAAEAAIGGTGIGLGEAKNLRQALASQGWSNQRSGGAFGFTVGGNQENLALALEPLVKKGFNSTTSIEQLGEATNALRLGQATPEELKKTLEQLPEAAKILHKTLEAVTAGMEEFAAKSVEGGSSMIHGMKAYGEVAKITGMNPTIIQGINNSSFGQVQAMSEGVKPWDIEGMSGSMKSLSALKTLEKLEGYTPAMKGTKKINSKGEVEEISPEAEKYAYIHMLDPSITKEQAERLHQIGPKLKVVSEGEHQAKRIGENVVGYQQENQEHKAEVQNAYHEEVMHRHEETSIQQLKKEIANTRGEDLSEELFGGGNGGKKGELEERLRQTEESAKNRSNKISSALATAKKDTGLTGAAQKRISSELQGSKGLYRTAEEAGISQPELENIKKDKLAQQPGEITKALEKLNSVNIERENEENAKVELSPEAKKWFKLQFPNAKSPKEESNAGGKSTSSGATNVTGTGESAVNESYGKRAAQIHRSEG